MGYNRNVSAEQLDGTNKTTKTIIVPNECPRCKTTIHEKVLYTSYFEDTVCSLFRCGKCEKYFISTGRMHQSDQVNSFCEPIGFVTRKFDEYINEISPDFEQIYNEALAAETNDLKNICGMAYRKSVEFLIKDFAIYRNKDKADEIKSASLSAVIKNYISSKQIKTLAERISWIGNDETHYQRKHQDLDFEDMKVFIDAAASFISSEIAVDKALKIEYKK